MFDPEWKHVYLDPRRGPTHFEYSKSLTTIFTDPCDSLTTWTTTASASIVAGGGYGSTNGLALGGAGNARWTIPSGSRSDRINASFRWKSSSLAVAHDICSWRTSGGTVNQLKLTSTTAGALTLLGGGAVIGTTADGVVVANTWYLIEVTNVRIADSPNGTVTLKVNGATLLTLTGVDTSFGTASPFILDEWAITTTGSGTQTFDDITLVKDDGVVAPLWEMDVHAVCSPGYGNEIDVAIGEGSASYTVYRSPEVIADLVPNSPPPLQPVRGLTNMAPGTFTSVIDFEIPLEGTITYHIRDDVAAVIVASITVPAFSDMCNTDMILRDLLSPEFSGTTRFCLGTIQPVNRAIRAGVFSVINRSAPVVTVDSEETGRGTLVFLARDVNELYILRALFLSPDPMLLQTSDYNFTWIDGLLYFQPLSIVETWMPDATIPTHKFEVEFVEIAPPPLTTVFSREFILYNWVPTGLPGETGAKSRRGLLQRHTIYDTLTNSGMSYAAALFDTSP
jgi:hypothetical protein